MRGMNAGPGANLGSLSWFVGTWVIMMAAMMLPSVAPMALLYARVGAERRRRGRAHVATWIFLAGYFACWTGYGLAAYSLFRVVRAAHLGFLAWNMQGAYVAGAAVAAAGLYQLTPLKRVCLRHCRSPMHFVVTRWREGRTGALTMGIEHGTYCVGCCWGLMVILFALGLMSITWMTLVALLIFAEKVLPGGERLARVFALAFLAAGIWIAIAPGSVPGLHTHPTPMKM